MATIWPVHIRDSFTPPTNVSGVDMNDYCARKMAGLHTGPIPDRGPQSIAAIWSLIAASFIFMMVRLYCKKYRLRGLWWDDYVLILSWVCTPLNIFIPRSQASKANLMVTPRLGMQPRRRGRMPKGHRLRVWAVSMRH